MISGKSLDDRRRNAARASLTLSCEALKIINQPQSSFIAPPGKFMYFVFKLGSIQSYTVSINTDYTICIPSLGLQPLYNLLPLMDFTNLYSLESLAPTNYP